MVPLGAAQFTPPTPKEMPLPVHHAASLSQDLEAFLAALPCTRAARLGKEP